MSRLNKIWMLTKVLMLDATKGAFSCICAYVDIGTSYLWSVQLNGLNSSLKVISGVHSTRFITCPQLKLVAQLSPWPGMQQAELQ